MISNSKILVYLFSLLLLSVFTACNDDDMEPEEELELITTLIYTFTPDGGGDAVILSFQDTDGDGGNAPVITTDAFQAGTTYTGTISLLDESKNPAENIGEEVEEEAEEHQFFFSVQGAALDITYQDQDADGNPIGLATQAVAGAAGTGTLTVILRHEPDKDAAGVSDGGIANAGGESDIEVTFDIEIQ